MGLKIIALEEHYADFELSKAVAPVALQAAPYMHDLGSILEDDPSAEPQDKPRLQGPKRADHLAGAPIAERLSDMDENGIDMQILSSTRPIQLLPAPRAVEMAKQANGRLAEIVAEESDRFRAFGTLPWQDVEAAVRELGSLPKSGFVGILLSGYLNEERLIDDPVYDPILAALEHLQMPLYIHPGPPLPAVQKAYYSGFNRELIARFSLFGWGWHSEAGIQVVRLILSGALDRHPGLRIISGHWGEMVPFFLQRMDDTMPPVVTGLTRTISRTYRDQVYVAPSGMLNLPHFHFVKETLGAERILFAVDYPYLTLTGARKWLEFLPVSDDERSMIGHRNAEELLKLS